MNIKIKTVILIVAAALFIGFTVGSKAGFMSTAETASESTSDTVYAVDEEPVLTIDGSMIMINEINARIYMLRDECVEEYGEEPWDIQLDGGTTVAEQAKQQMYETMVSEVLLMEHAGEYDVDDLAQDEIDSCTQKAQDYVDELGMDVAEEFGITAQAMETIYEKEMQSLNVYNAILGDLTDQLKADPDNEGLDDEAFEDLLLEAYGSLYSEWYDSCKVETTDTWDAVNVGAVG